MKYKWLKIIISRIVAVEATKFELMIGQRFSQSLR